MTISMESTQQKLRQKQRDVAGVLEIIFLYGLTDGAHHKQWVLDQVVKILAGNHYDDWVKDHNGQIDSDGETEYKWDVGIPP